MVMSKQFPPIQRWKTNSSLTEQIFIFQKEKINGPVTQLKETKQNILVESCCFGYRETKITVTERRQISKFILLGTQESIKKTQKLGTIPKQLNSELLTIRPIALFCCFLNSRTEVEGKKLTSAYDFWVWTRPKTESQRKPCRRKLSYGYGGETRKCETLLP